MTFKITYKIAKEDHEYLWRTYAPANDMTGGYVDSEDLEKLLEAPTKKTATDCYINQIIYWFQAGPDEHDVKTDEWKNDPKVIKIAERYGCEYYVNI